MEPLRIQVRQGTSGLLVADSPDLPGLHVMERDRETLKATLCELIPLLYAEQGIKCTVTSIHPVPNDEPAAWVIAGLRTTHNAKVD